MYFFDPAQAGPAEGGVAPDAEIKGSGAFVYEAGFQPGSTARTVSVRGGQAHEEDGGVAGTGDVVAGLYVVDVTDAEEAVGWAKRIPTAAYGLSRTAPLLETTSNDSIARPPASAWRRRAPVGCGP